MPTDTPRSYPLDPRTRECPCNGGRRSIPCPDGRKNCAVYHWKKCNDCEGTGQIPLHPEPRVSVAGFDDKWWWECGEMYEVFRGPFATPDEALQAARLAWLGRELMQIGRDCPEWVVMATGAKFSVLTETAAAIEAAFAAREEP